MTPFTFLGWTLVHSLWQCTLIAGFTALALGVLRHASAEQRDRVARGGLALMVVVPFITALIDADLLTPTVRRPVMMTVDRVIELPTYLAWRSSAIPAAGMLWTVGLVVCLIRVADAWRRARAWRSSRSGETDIGMQAEVAVLRRALSVQRPVEVRRSDPAQVPMVLGWRRPVILLPAAAVHALSADQLRSILAHELAHVRRGDYAMNLVQLAADGVLFHHPAARWVSRRIRVEREYCCDDIAAAASGDRAVYARALATLEDARSACRLAVAATSGTLLDRIERIAGRPRRGLTAARGALVLTAATAIAAAILAAAMVLPPSVPAGAQLRRRVPPAGAVIPAPASDAGTARPLVNATQDAPGDSRRS